MRIGQRVLRARGCDVGQTKENMQRRAALYGENNLTERQARFDVIEIRGAKLTHIKDAFPYRGPMF